jgi:hypothetical protein
VFAPAGIKPEPLLLLAGASVSVEDDPEAAVVDKSASSPLVMTESLLKLKPEA